MQAIILAAGLSNRLRPLTDTTPKCLLNIGKKNLLHRTIDNIRKNGIDDLIIVTGYKEEMIKSYVREKFSQLKIQLISNPDYANNNNSYSLWMTKDFVKEDVLLLDSDILFDRSIISELLKSKHENCLAVNVTKNLDNEQIRVINNEHNKIHQIGKEVSIEKSIGESIGIEKFSLYYMRELFAILDRKIVKENNVNEFYEVSFQEIIDNNNEKNSIFSIDVSDYKCIEIDTLEDYKNAQKILQD
jgi:choline kinase